MTIVAVLAVALRTKGTLRLWAPAIGIVAGSLVGAAFGIYDTARVADAGWIGIPPGRPPVPDIGFGPAFWALLPAFLFVALVGTTKSVAVAVAAQRVSWRRPRAVDFRAVQRAVAAEGAGNLLAGLAGTMPNTPNGNGVAAIEVTSVAARRVGIAAGLVFSVLAFVPKALALILAIPGAVVAASIAVIMATLFTVGMREVARSIGSKPPQRPHRGRLVLDGRRPRVRHDLSRVFRGVRGRAVQQRVDGGGPGGALLTGLTARRKRRLRGTLDPAELPRIREFIQAFSARHGLAEVRDRLEAASEEALLTLLESREAAKEAGAADGNTPDEERHELLLTASEDDDEAVLEFRVGVGGGGQRRPQPPGPARVARGGHPGSRRGAGDLAPAAPAPRLVRPAPAVSTTWTY